MLPLNLKQLEAFAAVADHAGFRAAAERLNTTQPNVSARIAALEAVLGARLFDRGGGGVRLTPAGARLLPAARAALRAAEQVVVAAGRESRLEGTLRLGVTEMIVHSWLAKYLGALKARFPAIDVDLTVDFSANLSVALADRALDLALQNGPFERATSGEEPLGAFPWVWVAAPSLGLGRVRMTLDRMLAHPVLTHARGTPSHDQIAAHLAATGAGSARLVASTNLAACLHMAEGGLGVACLPGAMVTRALAAGRLEHLDYPFAPDALVFSARYDAAVAPHHVVEAARLAARVAKDDTND